jgi:uncharacterized membrane protein YdjX (TVP38/TMEM64 family)
VTCRVLNYALALTCISMPAYAAASAAALLPYALLYAYLGSVSSDVVKVRERGVEEGRCA